MKKILLCLCVFTGGVLSAQLRYHSEVFSQVQVTSDVTYGTNIDFLKNSDFSNQGQVAADITDLKTLVATSQSIPAKYYDPSDASTVVKVSDVSMDIYQPANDSINNRPLVIYVHTGNFLPPPLNGYPTGTKNDSSAVVTCTKLAKRGFVAISMDYRLGWNPLANDPVTGPVIRRATLLNAVYRAIHDVRHNVRQLKADAAASNTYGIDTSNIVLYGEGSGGYVVLAYATLNKQSETQIQKFVYPGTQDSSYVQPSLVGDVEGFGGLLNLYTDNGHTSEVSFVVNAGGALADTSWLEAGDPPMVAIHTLRDPFAPFDHGTVIVPTTQEDVVDVHGPNVFIPQANALGNNASYQNFTYSDPYTMAARSHYGQTYQYRSSVQTTMTVDADAEGLFTVLRPYKANKFENEGAPWQWWDPNSAAAQTVVSAGPPAVTAHQNALSSNPDMSPSKGRAYTDSILNYAVPRIMVGLQLDGYAQIGMTENALEQGLSIFPNPANEILNVSISPGSAINNLVLRDVSGKLIMSGVTNASSAELNLSGLKTGIYLLEIHTNEGVAVRRLMKN